MSLLSKELVVFAPACLLCPAFQANRQKSCSNWEQGIISFLIENKYSIIQMPCPESTFNNNNCGLGRRPHGIQFYENLDGFKNHCKELSENVLSQILNFYNNNFIVVVLGIEHSPTCAVNYMYTRQGTVKRSGIFIGVLSQLISKKKLEISIIGINKRFPSKAIGSMEKLSTLKGKIANG